MRASGWRPRIERLEEIEKFSEMRLADYQEAWAWVHLMLHSTPEARQALITYLEELRAGHTPMRISARLKQDMPNMEAGLLTHLASLHSAHAPVGSLEPTALNH
jgi:hypothetical protein